VFAREHRFALGRSDVTQPRSLSPEVLRQGRRDLIFPLVDKSLDSAELTQPPLGVACASTCEYGTKRGDLVGDFGRCVGGCCGHVVVPLQ
jgi:hypothetical protein